MVTVRVFREDEKAGRARATQHATTLTLTNSRLVPCRTTGEPVPVPMSTLRENEKPLKQRALEFLSANRGQAFDIFEIGAAVDGTPTTTTAYTLAVGLIMLTNRNTNPLARIEAALSELINEGQVTKGSHQGRDYYGVP